VASNKLSNLLAQRRCNQMELAMERDPQAQQALRDHIAQLNSDIAVLVDEQYDSEVTQVTPSKSMRELVYGTGNREQTGGEA